MKTVTEFITNQGTYQMKQIECSNGAIFDAESCYQYCLYIGKDADYFRRLQSRKLIHIATKVSDKSVLTEDWYKNRRNFKDIEIED